MSALSRNDHPLPVISTTVFINSDKATSEYISQGMILKNSMYPGGKSMKTNTPIYATDITNISSKKSTHFFKNINNHNTCNPYSHLKPGDSKWHYTCNLNTGFDDEHSFTDKRKALPINEKSNIKILS